MPGADYAKDGRVGLARVPVDAVRAYLSIPAGSASNDIDVSGQFAIFRLADM